MQHGSLLKRIYLSGFPVIFFLMIAGELFAQQGDAKISEHMDKVMLAMNRNDEEVKSSFWQYISYCRQTNNDSAAMDGIDRITDYYLETSNYFEAIRWYFYAVDSLCPGKLGPCIKFRREFGELFARVGDTERAIAMYRENIRALDNKKHAAAEMLDYTSIANLHLYNGQADSAQLYYEAAQDAGKQHGKLHSIVISHNNLGFFYLQTNNLKSAELQFLKGIQLLQGSKQLTETQQHQLALLKGNLGGLYLKHGQAEKGIPLLEEDMRVNLGSAESEMGINAAMELANYFYTKGQYQRSESYLIQCLPYEKDLQSPHRFVNVYEALFRNAMARGNLSLARRYHTEYEKRREERTKANQAEKLGIEKSLLRNILQSQLAYQQKEIALKEAENEVLEQRSRYVLLRSIIIAVAVLIVLLFSGLYFRKRMSMLKIKKQLAEQAFKLERIEKEKVDTELKYKNKDLTDFAIDLARKQEILQDLKEKLYELRNARLDELDSKKRINELIQYANNNMLVDAQLMEFQRNIEEINYRFFDTLKERFPELTDLDKQVCGLIRLGLSNKEIAIMRNVSYKAVRMSRYRIRKKMQLDSEEDMVDFLKTI